MFTRLHKDYRSNIMYIIYQLVNCNFGFNKYSYQYDTYSYQIDNYGGEPISFGDGFLID